jgi:hypothetical protein
MSTPNGIAMALEGVRVGVLLLLGGWATLDIATLRRRGRLASRPGPLTTTAIAATGAAGVIAWSLLGDHGAPGGSSGRASSPRSS